MAKRGQKGRTSGKQGLGAMIGEMIAEFSLLLPSVFILPVDAELPPLTFEHDDYKVKIYPPTQAAVYVRPNVLIDGIASLDELGTKIRPVPKLQLSAVVRDTGASTFWANIALFHWSVNQKMGINEVGIRNECGRPEVGIRAEPGGAEIHIRAERGGAEVRLLERGRFEVSISAKRGIAEAHIRAERGRAEIRISVERSRAEEGRKLELGRAEVRIFERRRAEVRITAKRGRAEVDS